MRLRLTLCAIACLLIGACGSDQPTLFADDSGESTAPIDDSAPTVSVPRWGTDEEILEQYPILRLMSEATRPQVGSAQFMMVDDMRVPVPTESDEHPAFLVEVAAWYGVRQPMEFSIRMSYVEVTDATITSRQCADRSGGFSMVAPGSHRLNRQGFPEVQNTSLGWTDAGCSGNESVALADFFDSVVMIDISPTGFTASNQVGEKAQFLRIPPIDDTTQLATTNLVYRENTGPRNVIDPAEPPPQTTTSIVEGSVDILTAESDTDEGMQALSTFTLQYDPELNCLYHDEPDNNGEPGTGGRVTLVWPFGYTAVLDNGQVAVRNADGTTVARTNDTFMIGGGMRAGNSGYCNTIGTWIANGPPIE